MGTRSKWRPFGTTIQDPHGIVGWCDCRHPYVCLRAVEVSVIRHTKAQSCFITFAACCRELRSESSSLFLQLL